MNKRKWWMQQRYMEPAKDGGEGGGGGAGDGNPPVDDKGGDDGKGGKGGKTFTNEEAAALLKESMKRKKQIEKLESDLESAAAARAAAAEKLKNFDGIDPEQVRKLLQAQADREREEAEKRGEFDRVKAAMLEEHKKSIEKIQTESGTKIQQLSESEKKLQAQVVELTIGRSFGDSQYLRTEALPYVTPQLARRMFGDHFEVQDGSIVAYDKPAGAKDRTPLVDGSGNPLGFEQALQKIVEAAPEADSLLKSKVRPGGGSGGDGGEGGQGGGKATVVLSGRERIAAALKGAGKPAK